MFGAVVRKVIVDAKTGDTNNYIKTNIHPIICWAVDRLLAQQKKNGAGVRNDGVRTIYVKKYYKHQALCNDGCSTVLAHQKSYLMLLQKRWLIYIVSLCDFVSLSQTTLPLLYF